MSKSHFPSFGVPLGSASALIKLKDINLHHFFMKYHFSWLKDEKLETFTTCCPQMAEVMMRSQADFPKRTPEIQADFVRLYGEEKGKFEKLLREIHPHTQILGEIRTGIANLSVKLLKEEIEFC